MNSMRKHGKLLLVLAGLLVAAVLVPNATIGRHVYTTAMQLETTLYGLRKSAVDIGEIRLSTYQGGPEDARDVVIMVHGYSADKDVWPRFARHFTDRYRVIIPDLAGHGDTGFDPRLRHDTRSQAARVIALMDKLGIARAHIIGNSMGGFIAAQLAHDHPDRIRSATLIDAAGVLSATPSQMDLMLAQGRNPFEIRTRDEFDAFYAMTMARAPWVPASAMAFIAERYMAQREQLARIFRDFHHVGLLDDALAAIKPPVFIIWGRHDQLIHVSAAEKWASGLPRAELAILDDLGHMPMLEAPGATADMTLAFINPY